MIIARETLVGDFRVSSGFEDFGLFVDKNSSFSFASQVQVEHPPCPIMYIRKIQSSILRFRAYL